MTVNANAIGRITDHKRHYLLKGIIALTGLLIVGLAWQPLANLLALLGAWGECP